jgi:pyruvate/2-oxoglutarate dehydrogenase complex dihydrolipoamide dehydrogenase (E3) component
MWDPRSSTVNAATNRCWMQNRWFIVIAGGGASGIYVASLLDRLGIAVEMKPKTKRPLPSAIQNYTQFASCDTSVEHLRAFLRAGSGLPLAADRQRVLLHLDRKSALVNPQRNDSSWTSFGRKTHCGGTA